MESEQTIGGVRAEQSSITVAHAFGEISWLLGLSREYDGLLAKELIPSFLPMIRRRQFHLFYQGKKTIGAALWANVDAQVDNKIRLNMGNHLWPLAEEEYASGSICWLLHLVSPFANPTNGQREVMVGDLVAGPLQGRAVNMPILIGSDERQRRAIRLPEDAGKRVADALLAEMIGKAQ